MKNGLIFSVVAIVFITACSSGPTGDEVLKRRAFTLDDVMVFQIEDSVQFGLVNKVVYPWSGTNDSATLEIVFSKNKYVDFDSDLLKEKDISAGDLFWDYNQRLVYSYDSVHAMRTEKILIYCVPRKDKPRYYPTKYSL